MLGLETLAIALLLIMAANGAPILMSFIQAHRSSLAVDLGYRFIDGRPLFGASKTWRGLAASFILTLLLAWLLGVPTTVALLIAALAMLGDLISSFIKRRLKKDSSEQSLFIDQLPESFLPAYGLFIIEFITGYQLLLVVVLFFVLELVLSKFLYRLGIRKKPY